MLYTFSNVVYTIFHHLFVDKKRSYQNSVSNSQTIWYPSLKFPRVLTLKKVWIFGSALSLLGKFESNILTTVHCFYSIATLVVALKK